MAPVPLTVTITRDFDHMSEVAAGFIHERISRVLGERASFTLGLATGLSPTGVYKHLAKAANAGSLDAARTRTFNLDEYVGLPGGDPQARTLHRESYSFFMVRELFGLMRAGFAETRLPRGCLIDQSELEQALAASPATPYFIRSIRISEF